MSDSKPMGSWLLASLAVYLGVASIAAGYFVYSLWASAPDLSAIQLPQCDSAAKESTSKAIVQGSYPRSLSLNTAQRVEFVGCQLPSDVQVQLNGKPHAAPTFEDSSHIGVELSATDVSTIGSATVTFWQGPNEISTPQIIPIGPPSFQWRFLARQTWTISQEVQLLLLVIFMGMLASSVYACKSLADYEGDGKLGEQWLLFYLIQPIEGGGIAILFYVVIRGGFLTATGTDIKSVNQFGMCAVAGLAGAFSDIAFMKLREVFQTMFKPQDDRGGKITPLKILTTTLPSAKVGMAYNVELEASSGVTPRAWSVTPQLPLGLALDATSGVISGTPTIASPSAKYRFNVTDSGTPPSSATTELSLEVES